MVQSTIFANLFAAIKAENAKNFQRFKDDLKEVTEVKTITQAYGYYGQLLTAGARRKEWANLDELKAYVMAREEKRIAKEEAKQLTHLQTVEAAPELSSITVSMEWKRSRMWGSNPSAEAAVQTTDGFNRYESGSIGGCGYDKGSTAVANAVNQSNSFLKALYLIKEKQPTAKNHDVFGYGSGYGILPRLEGGVGVSCYPAIFEKIGFTFKTTASGKSFDVYTVTKK